ncbi:MAG: cation:proton antiporter [Candidatus Helarchaeota archaeon]|nr:cation:proton antiporter [Candidatus Helarchaeota archaeon]
MAAEYQLLILMIIIVSVTIFLFLGEKVRISAISIELILGMILGNFVFGVIPYFPSITALEYPNELFWLKFLADIGFILLMFLAGLELNILFLKKYFKKSIILLICVFFLSFFTGILIGQFLLLDLAGIILIGIVFAGASIGIVFPLLHELGLSQKHFGQILITTTMALDILCILIISFIGFTVETFNISQLVLAILIVVLFFMIILFVIGPFWRHMESKTTDVKALEWETRITFAVIMILAVLTGFILEIEAIIGAFLAGMIMGQSKSAPRLEEKMGSIGYGFFIPIFFFVIGMHMNLSLFVKPSFIITLIIFLLILFAVKIASSILGSKFMGYNLKTGLITGFIMIPSLSVGIAAAKLGNDVGLFAANPDIYTLLIALIVISSILIPILTRSSAKKLIPDLVSKDISWHVHLEHDLGIYLDESYRNVFEEITVAKLPQKSRLNVNLDTPITTILEYMETYHQMNFPVVSNNNQLLGIVDFDDIKKFILENKLGEIAGTIMRTEYIFVAPDDPLSVALDKMRKFDLELLPIIDTTNLQLLGTVSRDGILRFIKLLALGLSVNPEDLEGIEKSDES